MRNKLFGLFMAAFAMISTNVLAGGGGGHDKHYGKVTVTKTGEGSVYIGTSNDATSGNTEETWNCESNGDNDSKTYYLFATPQSRDYVFKGWSGDGTSSANPYEVTVKATSTTEGTPTAKSYTATFVEKDSWHKVASAPAAGNFYIYNPYKQVFLKKTSEVTTDPLEATRFTLSGSNNCSIAYTDNGTKYVSEDKGAQNWGSSTNWTITENNGGYYLMHNSDYNRYLNYNGSGIDYIRKDFTDDNRTWVFIPEEKMTEYIQNNASMENPVNLTSYIVNPDFEASTWNQGWNGTGDNKEVAFIKNDTHTNFAEMWKGDAVGGKIYQTINDLPKGYYTLSASTAGDVLNCVYAKVGDNVYQQAKGEGDWNTTSVVFRVDEEQADVEIGYMRPDNVWWWSAVDNFELKYMGTNPTYEYNNGIRLDGSYLSKPAYTSTPADGIDPGHANDALLVVTWRENSTTDPTDAVNPLYKLAPGSKAEVWVDGAKQADVDLLSDFRSSHYDNGFGLYIPNFDEEKTYTVKVPANVFGYTQAGHGNEAFEIQAKQSPIKDGKYFIRVAGTTKHISRGGHFGTQAILDNYGVPVLVQTAGLTVFKFLDNNAFFGNDLGSDDMYTDCFDDRTRRYNLIPDDEENPTKVQFFTPARSKYLYHANDAINGVEYEKMSEGAEGDWYDFEPFTVEGYAEHLHGIEDAEAQRVAERAGLAVTTRAEYNTLIDNLETAGATTVWPVGAEQETASATYHEARNNDLPVEAVWEPAPKDLIGDVEKLVITLDKGLYCVSLNAFQQASALAGLQQNLGFRGLVYYYVKVGNVISKDQLKSITETTGSIPTTEEEAKAALTGTNYRSRIIFYVPANDTEVEFGVQNPQRLGNGIDATADSWVAFQNLVVEKFEDLYEADMTVKANKYGTFVAPFNVKVPDGITAYNASINEDGVTIDLEEIVSGIIPAETPVILQNTTEDQISQQFRGIETSEVYVEKGILRGYYVAKAQDVPLNYYVLQTQNDVQAFYKVNQANYFNAAKNRCYIIARNPSSAPARLSFAFGEATDINNVQFNVINNNTAIYNLNGQRVNANAKGIVIVNGKKVVLR